MFSGSHRPIGGRVKSQGSGALKDLCFSWDMTVVSTLVGGVAIAQGLGAALLCWFHFFFWCEHLG